MIQTSGSQLIWLWDLPLPSLTSLNTNQGHFFNISNLFNEKMVRFEHEIVQSIIAWQRKKQLKRAVDGKAGSKYSLLLLFTHWKPAHDPPDENHWSGSRSCSHNLPHRLPNANSRTCVRLGVCGPNPACHSILSDDFRTKGWNDPKLAIL